MIVIVILIYTQQLYIKLNDQRDLLNFLQIQLFLTLHPMVTKLINI